MSNHTHSRLPQSRRKTPLLPLIVARYLQTSYPAALDPFLAAAEIDSTALVDHPAVRQGLVPDLRTLVEEYEAWLLEHELRRVTLAEATAARRSDTMAGGGGGGDERGRTVPLGELVKRPVTPEAAATVLQRVQSTYDQIGTGGFLSVKWEKVAKREFDTGTARSVPRGAGDFPKGLGAGTLILTHGVVVTAHRIPIGSSLLQPTRPSKQ